MTTSDLALPLVVDGDRPDARVAPAVAMDAALEQLVTIGAAVAASELDLDRVLRLVAEQAASLLHTEIAWIALYEPRTSTVRVRVSHGTQEPDFDRMQVPFGQGLGGTVLDHGRTLVITDYPAYQHATEPFVRDAMRREGVTSVMCAPMSRGDNMVGALYAANRAVTRFDADHASVLTTLAAQASVAMENRRLYDEEHAKTRLLEQTFEIHRRLGEAATSELGLDGVLAQLAALTGRTLSLTQDRALPFERTVSPGASEGAPPDGVAALVPIALHGRQVGHVTVHGEAPVSALAENALTHGATVLALELLRHQAAHEAEWRLRGALLDDLLAERPEHDEVLVVRARRFGIDLVRMEHRVLVAEPAAAVVDLLEDHVRRHRGPAKVLWTRRAEQAVVAVIGGTAADARQLAELLSAGGQGPAVVGISAQGRSFAASVRQAGACAALARRAGSAAGVVGHDELGALGFMLDADGFDHAFELVRTRLGAVVAYDRAHDTDLLMTLRAFLETGGRHQEVARLRHIHPNTVKYRLGRLRELLPVSPDDAQGRFELQLAMRLLDLVTAGGADPFG